MRLGTWSMPYSLASSGLLIFTKAIPCQSNNVISNTLFFLLACCCHSGVVVGTRFLFSGWHGTGRDETGGGGTEDNKLPRIKDTKGETSKDCVSQIILSCYHTFWSHSSSIFSSSANAALDLLSLLSSVRNWKIKLKIIEIIIRWKNASIIQRHFCFSFRWE